MNGPAAWFYRAKKTAGTGGEVGLRKVFIHLVQSNFDIAPLTECVSRWSESTNVFWFFVFDE